MSSTTAEIINKELVALYKSDKPKSKDALVEYTDNYDLQTLRRLQRHAQKYKQKSFHVKDVTPIVSDKITSYAVSLNVSKEEKKQLEMSDMTGLFKVKFSTGDIMYYAKWVSGFGRDRSVEGMFVTESHVWFNFLNLLKKERKRIGKPKVGVFRVYSVKQGSGSQLVYSKIAKLVETPIVHPAIQSIAQDVDFFYNNVSLFTRFGMPGVRKIILIGEPGSGKTSATILLARKYASAKCIAFTTSISDCAAHLEKCAKHNVSTLVILEDAEVSLKDAGSSILNFLDGIDQPQNKNGAYIIMTTNHPNRIEPRILHRPGRVDKLVNFGAIHGKYLLKCAEIYFNELLFNKDQKKKLTKKEEEKEFEIKKELLKVLGDNGGGMTGAQVKELSQSSVSYAVSNNRELTVELISEVKDKMAKDMKEARNFAIENSMIDNSRKGIGFGSNSGKNNVTESDEELEEFLGQPLSV